MQKKTKKNFKKYSKKFLKKNMKYSKRSIVSGGRLWKAEKNGELIANNFLSYAKPIAIVAADQQLQDIEFTECQDDQCPSREIVRTEPELTFLPTVDKSKLDQLIQTEKLRKASAPEPAAPEPAAPAADGAAATATPQLGAC